MKLYLIERLGDTDYDQAAGYVVSAPSPRTARRLCQADDDSQVWNDVKDEMVSTRVWVDSDKSSCRLIGTSREPQGIVLRDFRAG